MLRYSIDSILKDLIDSRLYEIFFITTVVEPSVLNLRVRSPHVNEFQSSRHIFQSSFLEVSENESKDEEESQI